MRQENRYTKADAAEAARQIADWLGTPGKGRTKAALARAAGISPATVSQILTGRYPSDPSAHIEAMTAAVSREESREREPAEIPYTETSIGATVRAVIRRAHQDRDMGFFGGRVGIGKTVALRRYAADHAGTAVLIEAYPGAGAPVVLRLIARAIGAIAARRTVADTTAAIVDSMSGSDRVILVDEAETLTPPRWPPPTWERPPAPTPRPPCGRPARAAPARCATCCGTPAAGRASTAAS